MEFSLPVDSTSLARYLLLDPQIVSHNMEQVFPQLDDEFVPTWQVSSSGRNESSN